MTRFHFTKKQSDLVEAFEAGDFGEVEFFELALEVGIDLANIIEILAEMRIDIEIAGEGTIR